MDAITFVLGLLFGITVLSVALSVLSLLVGALVALVDKASKRLFNKTLL